MAIVSGIRVNRGLVDILADGAVVARVRRAHFEKCPLSEGQTFDVDAYLGRVAAAQFAEAYEDALTRLDRCARSAKQLRDALRRKGYVEPTIDAVLSRLSENRLIDDAQYAARMAELQSKKPVGVYAFKRKLRARGISDADAREALSAFDDDQQQAAALEAARALWRRYEALPAREARAKLSQALARRGFAWDAISQAVDAMIEEDTEL